MPKTANQYAPNINITADNVGDRVVLGNGTTGIIESFDEAVLTNYRVVAKFKDTSDTYTTNGIFCIHLPDSPYNIAKVIARERTTSQPEKTNMPETTKKPDQNPELDLTKPLLWDGKPVTLVEELEPYRDYRRLAIRTAKDSWGLSFIYTVYAHTLTNPPEPPKLDLTTANVWQSVKCRDGSLATVINPNKYADITQTPDGYPVIMFQKERGPYTVTSEGREYILATSPYDVVGLVD